MSNAEVQEALDRAAANVAKVRASETDEGNDYYIKQAIMALLDALVELTKDTNE